MLRLPAPVVVALLGAVPALPGALILAGILAGPDARGIFADVVNPRYFEVPAPIALHIAAGILFCLLAPLQFSARLRRYAPRWHRMAGRIAMVAGLVFGLSALPILPPRGETMGWLHQSGLVVASVAFAAALIRSYWAIRRRDIPAHRVWALRAVAIGLMGASRVLIETLAWLILGTVSEFTGGAVIWLAIGLNLLIVERFLLLPTPFRRHVTPDFQKGP